MNLCEVLIVDDEMLVRQGIKYLLDWEREGFRITGEAGNGREALALIESLRPQLVITDIVMPVMDGEELTRRVKQDYPGTEVIVLSSFSEFDYVRSSFQSGAADYILKPKLEAGMLLGVLREARSRLPGGHHEAAAGDASGIEPLLCRLLAGYDAGQEIGDSSFPYGRFLLLGCCGEEPAFPQESGTEPPLLQLRQALNAAADEAEAAVYTLRAEEREMLLANGTERGLERVRQLLAQVDRTQEESWPQLQWIVSQPFSSLAELRDVHRDSYSRLLRQRFFLPERRMLDAELLHPASAPPPAFSLPEFAGRVKRLQLEEAFDEMRRYVEAAAGYGQTDVFEFKSLLGGMVFTAATQLSHLPELEEEKYRMFRRIDEARHVREAVDFMDEFAAKVLGWAGSRQPVQGSGASVRKVLDYIEEHYAEPLTLTELAARFHFNPTYLSTLFTAQVKEGFKEYLNKIRTDKAAVLLRSGELPIADIGSRVGYGDHSYFCKVFRKYTGLSPSEYRRKHWGMERGQ
ncbi:response regulator [Paenibacillus sp. CN-4]|uniref:response regulator n=1 Tax=Paenibacillus nanchangensis TaxID=3348343 RepID=UPI00397A0E7B